MIDVIVPKPPLGLWSRLEGEQPERSALAAEGRRMLAWSASGASPEVRAR